ncbi:MAG: S8/S53 family peptidase [Acidimicrobiia bacterium]|nr:S8/S53 family peptidase [Acidimicrobiia bacterium]
MCRKEFWAALLTLSLLATACGGDDDSTTTADPATTTAGPVDSAASHECIISEKYLRARLDIETFWPAEFMEELDVFWDLELPDVFKAPPDIPRGSVFIPTIDAPGNLSALLAPDGTVLIDGPEPGDFQSGGIDLLGSLVTEDGRVLLPEESQGPDGWLLPEGGIWSSDGETVVVDLPGAEPSIFYSATEEIASRGFASSDVVEIALPGGAALLSPGLAAARFALFPDAASVPTGTWYVDIGSSGADSTKELAALVKSLPETIAETLDERLLETLSAQVPEVASAAGVGPSEDDLVRARELFPVDVEVEPIYAMSFEGHWSLEPGAEPFQSGANLDSPEALTTVPSFDGQALVAIVDSGFPVEKWVGLGEVPLDGSDTADPTGSNSHGLFVASLIRQLAPSAIIVGARADVLDRAFVEVGETSLDPLTGREAAVLTDEEAVRKALERLRSAVLDPGLDYSPSAMILNLSLGTYACGTATDIPPPTLIKRALEEFENAATSAGVNLRIFAAAGNEALEYGDHDGDEFYPAAFEVAHGVAAQDVDGRVVTWDEEGERTFPDPSIEQPQHIDFEALGVDVVGAGYDTMGYWSGSSFATAVMSGLAASGQQDDTEQQKCPDELGYGLPKTEQDGALTTDGDGLIEYDTSQKCRPESGG